MRSNYFGVKALSILLISLGVAGVYVGCNRSDRVPSNDALEKANSNSSQWVLQANPHSKVALVFVHGIFGDAIGSWTNQNGKKFFDLLASKIPSENAVDMFAFGFTSEMFSDRSFDIREAANKLQQQLLFHKVLDYEKIIFVAHSMGGLVTLRSLLTHRDLLNKVPLVFMYATPQEGADIAAWAKVVSNNPALSQLITADSNTYLQQISDDWRTLTDRERPKVVCAYERASTHGVKVVDWKSATRFCEGASTAIAEDHLGIVKPDRSDHDSIVVLINALNQFGFVGPKGNEAKVLGDVKVPIVTGEYSLCNGIKLGAEWPRFLRNVQENAGKIAFFDVRVSVDCLVGKPATEFGWRRRAEEGGVTYAFHQSDDFVKASIRADTALRRGHGTSISFGDLIPDNGAYISARDDLDGRNAISKVQVDIEGMEDFIYGPFLVKSVGDDGFITYKLTPPVMDAPTAAEVRLIDSLHQKAK